MTCKVLQESVLGPILWSLFYDNLLRLVLPLGMCVVGYADEVAVMEMAHKHSFVEDALIFAMERVG